jgi:molybdenum cofactor guanylyltransferase
VNICNDNTQEKHTGEDAIIGVLLAGGLGRRMGGVDKCLLPLGNSSLLQLTATRASPQVKQLLLSINGDPARFPVTLPVTAIQDCVSGYQGPLAGVLTAMQWIKQHAPQTQWLVSFATDTPYFPTDLVYRLHRTARQEERLLVGAQSKGRIHPVFSLWSLCLYQPLESFLLKENKRQLQAFFQQQNALWVDFSAQHIDPFFNINTRKDLQQASAFASEGR